MTPLPCFKASSPSAGSAIRLEFYRTLIILPPAFAVFLIVLAGCNKKESDSELSEKEDKTASVSGNPTSYKNSQGLFLSETLQKSIGLTTAPVQLHSMTPQISAVFQVFREATERSSINLDYKQGNAYASGVLGSNEASKLNVGQEMEVADPMDSGKTIQGKILRLDETLKSSNGQTEILVRLPDAENHLILGSFANGKIIMGSPSMRLSAPKSAILQTSQGTFAYVVHGRYFRRTPIETGSQTDVEIEILLGLSEGEMIVAHPVETLWLTELKAGEGAEK